jgi:peptide/nickel transport system permease protein
MSARWGTRLSVAFLTGTAMVTIFAGFFAPYDPTEQNRGFPFQPPMSLRSFDQENQSPLAANAYQQNQRGAAPSPQSTVQTTTVRFFAVGVPYRLVGIIPCDRHLFEVAQSSRYFLLGTDALGRDQLSRLLYGGQVTILVGLLGAAIALFLAVPLGAIAGYFGGWSDALLMRTVELFLAMPWLYLLLAVRAFLPLHVQPHATLLLLIVLMGIVGWARPARLVRGVARGTREQEFVLAARSAGAGPALILAKHIVPQTTSVVLTQLTLLIPQYMLAEMTLSFLGLGVSDPFPSWGNMLQAAQQYPVLASAWWLLAPGMIMIPIFWAFAVLADSAQQGVEFRQIWSWSARERLGA